MDAQALGRARAELAELEIAYDCALRRGCSERSTEGIADGFDQADRLQRRMLVAITRLRSLELADRGRVTAPAAPDRSGAPSANRAATAVEPRLRR